MSAVDTISELLAPHVETELRKITSAPVATIAPSPTNPRKYFDAAGMAELTDSVRRHGVMQLRTAGWRNGHRRENRDSRKDGAHSPPEDQP